MRKWKQISDRGGSREQFWPSLGPVRGFWSQVLLGWGLPRKSENKSGKGRARHEKVLEIWGNTWTSIQKLYLFWLSNTSTGRALRHKVLVPVVVLMLVPAGKHENVWKTRKSMKTYGQVGESREIWTSIQNLVCSCLAVLFATKYSISRRHGVGSSPMKSNNS